MNSICPTDYTIANFLQICHISPSVLVIHTCSPSCFQMIAFGHTNRLNGLELMFSCTCKIFSLECDWFPQSFFSFIALIWIAQEHCFTNWSPKRMSALLCRYSLHLLILPCLIWQWQDLSQLTACAFSGQYQYCHKVAFMWAVVHSPPCPCEPN